MASPSHFSEEIPFEDEGIIEAMSVNFDQSVDLLDMTSGIDLLGYLIADIEPGVGGVKATILGIWRNFGQIRIMRAKKNVYTIRVGSEKLARRLIDYSPWNVRGFCFSIRLWPLYHSIDDLQPTRATYWIQAHGIPKEMLSIVNGRKLGNILGSVIEVEDPAMVGYRGFLRLRIDLNASKPLPTFCQLPCHSGIRRIRLQYELLKNFCYKCGRLGHMISACYFQVNPMLIKLGVVYDQSLVAEPLQKPAFTLPHQPLEFPYIPSKKASDLCPTPGRVSSDRGEFQTSSVNGSFQTLLSASRSDGNLSSDLPPASSLMPLSSLPPDATQVPNRTLPTVSKPNHIDISRVTSSTTTESSLGLMTRRERLDMWHPDTNGTMFRNGSITVAIQGINLNSPSWADPEVIPPWAFKSRADFERANPLFPVPGFDNDSVLVPLPSAQPCVEELPCPPICPSVNKPITQRKRRARRPSPLALDEEAHPSKKGRPLISPSLRLSNSRGGRRGSRGSSNIRGRSRDTSNGCRDSDLGMGNVSSFSVHATHQSMEQHIRVSDSNWSSSMKGMEDLTHLQGCGGWPKPAARGQ